MSRSVQTLTLAFALCLTISAAESSAIGVWKASQGELPFVTLTIEQWNGKLTGAALFYLIRREPNGAQTASPGVPEPLLDMQEVADTLTFAVSHRNAHPPATLNDPPVPFKLKIKDAHRAVLTGPEGPPLELKKD